MTKPPANSTFPFRVAAYCRIDSSNEEQNPFLKKQKTFYAERIDANPGWVMAGVFADIGNSRSQRPEFQKMLRKCRQKEIDLILVPSITRFTRNTVECLNIVQELRKLGIAMIFEKENLNTMDTGFGCCIPVMDAIAQIDRKSPSHSICSGCSDKNVMIRME